MASYGHPSLPFASPQTLQTLKTHYGHSDARATHQWLLVATLAANRHPRATHQWLLMGIQICRLPALLQPTGSPGHTSILSYTLQTLQTLQALNTLQTVKNRKTLKTVTWHASSCSQQPPRATHQWLLVATLAANRHPKATHQWLLMGIQVCRLPALKPSKHLKPIMATQMPAPHINGFLWPLLQPTGTPGPRINGFLWASKSANCQPSCSQQVARATHQYFLILS